MTDNSKNEWVFQNEFPYELGGTIGRSIIDVARDHPEPPRDETKCSTTGGEKTFTHQFEAKTGVIFCEGLFSARVRLSILSFPLKCSVFFFTAGASEVAGS